MLRKYFNRLLPTPEALRANRSLRWLGPLLHRPWLWQFNRRTVAAGVGIGVFFGFLIPVLQIAFAAGFAVVLRANLPVAAASTLVSNPFTYAPIGVAAYQVGSALLGPSGTAASAPAASVEDLVGGASVTEGIEPGWWKRFADVGKQVMLGLAVFAVVGGIGAYFATLLVWRLAVVLRRRRRVARAAGARVGGQGRSGRD
jgi:uncharacterized protein (DUF2062 family)